LDDPRTGNAKRHSLHEIVVIGLCTVLCGRESCAGMALSGRSKRASAQDGTTISSLACFHSSPELKCDSPAVQSQQSRHSDLLVVKLLLYGLLQRV